MEANILRRVLALVVVTFSMCSGVMLAQTDTWVPANPTFVVPTQLSVSNCNGTVTVTASWVFNSGGYRVTQPHAVSRSGQIISLDSRVEEWTGGRTLALVPSQKNFDIGALEPGTYTLEFKSWGAGLKQTQFTIFPAQSALTAIDERCFFVSQHYRDFLSRESDGNGLAFWTNDIANCRMDATCIELKRINVSAAFFLSIEFRATGYYVYRTYRTALGRPPTFAEFVPESSEIGRNVVVGSNNPWSMILSSNQDLYTMSFFNRPEFQARYNGLTNTQYVDKLFETQGITPTPAERNELIDSLDNCSFTVGCPTRWNVLRRIVEHPSFDRKVFNEAFVTMEYFGYLRRDPDPQGFAFWLAKLNQFNGNFVDAEMVKAFITSDEYRRRF
jgi:hypothetical protein